MTKVMVSSKRPEMLVDAIQAGTFPHSPESLKSRTQRLAWYFRKAAELYPLQVLPPRYAMKLLDGKLPASTFDVAKFTNLLGGVKRELTKFPDLGLIRSTLGYRATVDADDFFKHVGVPAVERGRAGMQRAQERVKQCTVDNLNVDNRRLVRGVMKVFGELRDANIITRLQLTDKKTSVPNGS